MKHSNVRVTIIVSAKKIIVEILAHVFVRNANTQVITYDEIISVMDNVLTKMTSTTATNVTENYHSKKVRFYCQILHTVLLAIILLLVITIICYYNTRNRSKYKDMDAKNEK